MDVREPGAGVGRDIAAGETVEHELDAFISRRHEQRRKSEPERELERELEAAWAEAERREATRRRAANRAGWHSWHLDRAALYARMSVEHRTAAEGLIGETERRRTA